MEFKIYLEKPNNLYQNDASLCLGWFEITYKQLSFCIFKKGLCMVFLSLTTLIEFFKNSSSLPNYTYRWVGDDNGFTVLLNKKGNILEFTSQEIKFNVDFKVFKTTLLNYSKEFIKDCVRQNELIKDESAYLDLYKALEINDTK